MHLLRNWSVPLVIVLALLPAGRVWAQRSAFQQRMAAWQGGGIPAERAEAMPASPSDRLARPPMMTPTPSAAPAVTPANWQSADGLPQGEVAYDAGYDAGFEPGCACGAGGCGMGGCETCCGDCGGCNLGCNTLVWARFETILWWRQGRDLPPLVTTDPVNSNIQTAGELPGATILFGGSDEPGDMSVGGRFDIGTWFDTRQCYGVGWRFWGLGSDGMGFGLSSLQNPVIAVPVFDVGAGANEAVLIAFPGDRTGEINITGDSELFGNDVYGRFLLCRCGPSRLDFITGWHLTQFNDEINLVATTVNVNQANPPIGRRTTFADRFAARNQFNGGILGVLWERDCGCLSTQVLGRVSIGNMFERVVIDGSTTIEDPGQNPAVTQGGIFTAASNIGTHTRNEFTAVSEVGVNLAYRCGRCTQLTAGYTFMYFNDVTRPGDAINPNVQDPNGNEPSFTFLHRAYWVQGLNLGFECRF